MMTRVHVALPTELVEQLDEIVEPRRRSEYIEAAIRARLVRDRQRKALHDAAGMLRDADIPEWSTPEATSEWVRRNRDFDNDDLQRILSRWPE